MSYPGMRTNRSRRYKYEGCERSKVRGITVRLLSAVEISEFRAHIEKCLDMRSQIRRRTQ